LQNYKITAERHQTVSVCWFNRGPTESNIRKGKIIKKEKLNALIGKVILYKFKANKKKS